MDNENKTNSSDNWDNALDSFGEAPEQTPVETAETVQAAQSAQQTADPFGTPADSFSAFGASSNVNLSKDNVFGGAASTTIPPQQSFSADSFTSGAAETAGVITQAMPKKSKAPLIIGLCAAFAVIAGLLVWLFMFSDLFGTSYEKLARSNYTALMAQVDKAANSKLGLKESITLTPSEELIKLLGVTDELNPTTFNVDFATDGVKSNSSFTYKNGTSDILGISTWMNKEAVALLLPQLSDKYLSLSLEGTNNATLDIAELKKTIDAFVDKYFEIVKDAPVTKGMKVDCAGTELTADNTLIVFTNVTALELEKALYEVALENDNLCAYLESVALNYKLEENQTAKDYLQKQIDETAAKLETAKAGELETLASMDVYISGGKIVKRVISIPDKGDFVFADVSNGNEYTRTYSAIMTDNTTVSINVTDTGKTENKVSSGSITALFKSDSESLEQLHATVTYDGVSTTDNNLINGHASINITEIATIIDATFSAEGNAQKSEISVTVSGKNMGTITASAELTDGSEAQEMPALNADNSVNSEDFSSEEPSAAMQDFSLDVQSILTKIPDMFKDANGKYDIIGYYVNSLYTQLSTIRNTPDSTDDENVVIEETPADTDNDEEAIDTPVSDTALTDEQISYIEDEVELAKSFFKDDVFDFDAYCEYFGVDAADYADSKDNIEMYVKELITMYDNYVATGDTAELMEAFGLNAAEEETEDGGYIDTDTYYELSDLKFSLNGKEVALPLTMDGFTNVFPSIATDEISVDEYEKGYYSTEDGFTLSAYTVSDTLVPVREQNVYALMLSGTPAVDYSLNGVKFGTTIAETEKLLGTPTAYSLGDDGTANSYVYTDYAGTYTLYVDFVDGACSIIYFFQS